MIDLSINCLLYTSLAHVGDILHGLREGGADEYGLQVVAHGHETALTDPHDLPPQAGGGSRRPRRCGV